MRNLGLLVPIVLALHCHGAKPPANGPSGPTSPAPSVSEASQVLAALRADMDPGADPCQDFYRYACGGWLDRTEIPADQTRWARSFGEIGERNRRVVKEVLEGAVADPGDDPGRARLGAFYAACMDEEGIERAGIEPLKNLLRKIERLQEPRTLMSVAGQLHSIGIQVFFGAEVDADLENPQRAIVYLRQGGLGLPDRDPYLKEDERSRRLLAEFERHVARMLTLSGQNSMQAAENAGMAVAFEAEIAKFSLPRAELGDPRRTYHKIDRAGLEERIARIHWDLFFAGAEAPDVQDISVDSLEYFQKLSDLLAGTRLRNLKAYLRWQLIHGLAQHLPRSFAEENFDFYGAKLAGQKEIAPRWKRCVDAADRSLGEILGRAYVERAFAGDSLARATELLRGIESAFEASLRDVGWMDATTRRRAVQKLEALANKVGYPDRWREHAEIAIEPTSHLLNVIVARNFEVRRRIAEVGGPVDRGAWQRTPATVDAGYDRARNEIVFPAGILQPPLFHASFPPPVNYGGIGTVMGHELTHGFDDRGRRFDGAGRLAEWWEPEAASRFAERARCVEDLYSNYEVQAGIRLDGGLTLEENIADLGGIRQAYRAWLGQARRPGSFGPYVEGLTDEQLFFVAFAQTWCTRASPEVERVLATVDSHAHPRYRVIGPLSSFPEFARAFRCAEGTPMRPAHVCEVW